jgi:hypothetical protein
MALSLSRFTILWLFLLLLPNFFPPVRAQEGSPGPLLNRSLLLQMTRHSAYIFAGRVTSVALAKPARPNEVAMVRITFHVERGIRGVHNGQSLSIREWSGLWQAGERYRVGEKLLLFLYPASKLGLTSPVGGTLGRIPFDSNGEAVLAEAQIEALTGELDMPLRSRSHLTSQDLARRIRRAMEE